MKKFLDHFIIRSWWVFLILGVCYAFYVQAMRKKEKDLSDLHARLKELENKKQGLLLDQEDLIRQINSQSDPAWIQLMLMKGLGMVPEGQVKIYFSPASPEHSF